jgi:hypothetical protein
MSASLGDGMSLKLQLMRSHGPGGHASSSTTTLYSSSILDVDGRSAPPNDSLLFKMSKKIAQLTKIIYHLNVKHDDHDYHISSLRGAYEHEIDLVRAFACFLSRTCSTWRAQISEECRKRMALNEQEILALKVQVKAEGQRWQVEASEQQDQHARVAETIEMLKEEAKQAQNAANVKLQEQVAEAQASLTKAEHAWHARERELAVDLANVHAELQEAQKNAQLASEEKESEHESRIQELVRKHEESANQERARAERRLQERDAEHAAECAKIESESRRQLALAITSLDNAKSQWHEELQKARDQLHQARTDRDQVFVQLTNARQALMSAEGQVRQGQAELVRAKERLLEETQSLDDLRANFAAITKEKMSLQAQVAQLTDFLAEVKEQRDAARRKEAHTKASLQQEIARYQSLHAANERLQAQQHATEQQVRDEQTECKRMSMALLERDASTKHHMDSMRNDLRAKQEHLLELQRSAEMAAQSFAEMERQLAKQQRTSDALNGALAQLQQERDQLQQSRQAQLDLSKLEHAQHLESIRKAHETRIAALQASLDQESQEREDMRLQLGGLKQELGLARAKPAEVEAEWRARLAHELAGIQTQHVTAMQAQQAQFASSLEDIRTKAHEAVAKQRAAEERKLNAVHEARVEELLVKVQRAQAQVERANKDLAASKRAQGQQSVLHTAALKQEQVIWEQRLEGMRRQMEEYQLAAQRAQERVQALHQEAQQARAEQEATLNGERKSIMQRHVEEMEELRKSWREANNATLSQLTAKKNAECEELKTQHAVQLQQQSHVLTGQIRALTSSLELVEGTLHANKGAYDLASRKLESLEKEKIRVTAELAESTRRLEEMKASIAAAAKTHAAGLDAIRYEGAMFSHKKHKAAHNLICQNVLPQIGDAACPGGASGQGQGRSGRG